MQNKTEVFLYKFSSQSRLKNTKQIKSVLTFGRKIKSNGFNALYCNNELGCPRLGIIIPKRYVHLAVNRNSIKRIIRESFRLSQYLIGNKDIVIMVFRKDITDKNLTLCLEKVWQNLAISLST